LIQPLEAEIVKSFQTINFHITERQTPARIQSDIRHNDRPRRHQENAHH
jgi:hypothetical protein